MKFETYRLADDIVEYGSDAGKFLVVTDNGDTEVTKPMNEEDAVLLVGALNELNAYRRRYGQIDLDSCTTVPAVSAIEDPDDDRGPRETDTTDRENRIPDRLHVIEANPVARVSFSVWSDFQRVCADECENLRTHKWAVVTETAYQLIRSRRFGDERFPGSHLFLFDFCIARKIADFFLDLMRVGEMEDVNRILTKYGQVKNAAVSTDGCVWVWETEDRADGRWLTEQEVLSLIHSYVNSAE